MNKYAKPFAGSYKQPLIEGFKMLGNNTLALYIETGRINFGIVSTFIGHVNTIPLLIDDCVAALQAVPQTDITGYYIYELKAGNVMPCDPKGAYVYRQEFS